MSERDNTSVSLVAAGACCRVRRRMQCFGFRGKILTLIYTARTRNSLALTFKTMQKKYNIIHITIMLHA